MGKCVPGRTCTVFNWLYIKEEQWVIIMDITTQFNSFREAARHLWNVYFHSIAEKKEDWDLRDKFSEVYVSLFNALVKHPLHESASSIPHLWDGENKVLYEYQIVGRTDRVPIAINREKPASGYWDHSTDVLENSAIDMRLITILDFDQLGFRDFKYFRVRILRSSDKDIEGRDGLIEAEYCKVLFDASKINEIA